MARSTSRPPKKNLYESEATLLKDMRKLSEETALSGDEYQKNLKDFCDHYEDLLDQCKLITKVSDRLQNKINTANAKLEEKNIQLQQTIDALTEARVGRRAATYVLIIAVVLFVVSEAWLEPPIEDMMHAKFMDKANPNAETDAEFYASLGLKGVLALLLKPIEMVVESTLMKKARKQAKRQAELKQQ